MLGFILSWFKIEDLSYYYISYGAWNNLRVITTQCTVNVMGLNLTIIYTNILKGVRKPGTVPRGALPREFLVHVIHVQWKKLEIA